MLNKVYANEICAIKEEILAKQMPEIQRMIFNNFEASNSNQVNESQLNLYSSSNKKDLAYCLAVAEAWLEAEFNNGKQLSSPEEAGKFLSLKLRDLPHEVFSILLLDNHSRVIHYEELFRGTVAEAAVYPREVAKLALKHNASSVIFAHNHPSGDNEPSRADKQITNKLKAALDLVGVAVLDHLVIGNGNPESFANRGLL